MGKAAETAKGTTGASGKGTAAASGTVAVGTVAALIARCSRAALEELLQVDD